MPLSVRPVASFLTMLLSPLKWVVVRLIGALRRQGMAAIVGALAIVVCPQQDGQTGSRRIRFIFVLLRLAVRFVFAPGAPPDNILAASVRAVLTALRL